MAYESARGVFSMKEYEAVLVEASSLTKPNLRQFSYIQRTNFFQKLCGLKGAWIED